MESSQSLDAFIDLSRSDSEPPPSQTVVVVVTTTPRKRMPDEVLGALARLELVLGEWEPMPEDVHNKLSALRASLEEWPSTNAETSLSVVAPSHGRWIRAGGLLIDLKRRRPLRRLVRALVVARVERPGKGLDSAALIAAGWPDENVSGDVALNRLYVALTRLRQLGLMDILLSSSDGWLLSPSVRMEHITDEASDSE